MSHYQITPSKDISQIVTPHKDNKVHPILEGPTALKKQNSQNDDYEPGEEYQDQVGFQRKRKEGVKTFLTNGAKSALTLPKQTLQFLMNGGGRKNKIFAKNMAEKSQSSQQKMQDENFKKNHCFLYMLYFIGFYIQYVVMPSN